ncbi:MAG TPA: hypothetical protein DCS80_03535 [Betaproteobacteria bacterium]|nr:hypothetical protein [Betaproteobacteria bacterium]
MNTTEIKQLLAQAISAHRANNLNEADKIYQRILKLDPGNGDANHNRGVLKATLKEFSVAEKLFTQALKSNRIKEQYWISLVEHLLETNRIKKAKTVLNESVKKEFSSARLDKLKLKVREIIEDRRRDKAILRIDKKYQRVPTNKEIQHVSEALHNGDKELSRSLAIKMIKKYPHHPLGWKVQGVNNDADGKLSEAIIDAETVVRLDRADDEGHSNLAILFRKSGKLIEAEKSIAQAIELNPESSTYRIIQARIAELLKEVNRSENIYKTLIKRDPTNPIAFNEYGNYLYRIGRMPQALTMHKKAVELNPEDSEILHNLGKSFHALGKHNDAKLALNKSIAFCPNNEDAYHALGVIFSEEGNFEAAAYQFNKSSRLLSQTYLLRCYLEVGSLSDFKLQLKKINESSNVNAMLGSAVSRAELKFKEKIHNPFANDMTAYVHKASLNEHCNFKDLFEALAAEIIGNNNITRRPQSLLSNGEQTAGDLFQMGGKLVREAEAVIMNEITSYRERYAKSTDGFITKWPQSYKLNGWLINMTEGGSLAPHMHELGWLGGAVYISVPKKQGSDEGNFVVCKDGGEYLKASSKIVDVNSGDIVLFPASLMHYTIPFSSEKNRIVLAFDLIPS